jgi:uncharacterized protein (TIGR02266 family)
MAPEGASERRADRRVVVEVEVSFASESSFFDGVTQDLSIGGVFIATDRTLPVGSRVALAISLPGSSILARGLVRWARPRSDERPAGLGVAFESVGPEDQGRIEALCAGFTLRD